MPADGIDIVLFDLGGVLVDFGGVGAMRRLAGIDSDDELWRRWLTSHWVRTFERGQCSATDFAAGVVDEWGLGVSWEAFLAEFRDWPRGPLAGAVDLLATVREQAQVGCLSNTNALHWEHHCATWTIFDDFDLRFLSFELGLVKPDPELFAAVTELVPVDPCRVLFLDDNAVNVEAALSAGLVARRVQGVSGARQALVSVGVLTAPG
jgi:putative hydrolase of the HAD superfamily